MLSQCRERRQRRPALLCSRKSRQKSASSFVQGVRRTGIARNPNSKPSLRGGVIALAWTANYLPQARPLCRANRNRSRFASKTHSVIRTTQLGIPREITDSRGDLSWRACERGVCRTSLPDLPLGASRAAHPQRPGGGADNRSDARAVRVVQRGHDARRAPRAPAAPAAARAVG